MGADLGLSGRGRRSAAAAPGRNTAGRRPIPDYPTSTIPYRSASPRISLSRLYSRTAAGRRHP